MKTLKNIIAVGVIVVFMGNIALYASNSGSKKEKNDNKRTERTIYQQMAAKQLQELLRYPEDLKQRGVEGFVLISFTYDNDGNFNVTGANSNSIELLNYVTEQLAKMEMCSYVKNSGKEYIYRIDFRIY